MKEQKTNIYVTKFPKVSIKRLTNFNMDLIEKIQQKYISIDFETTGLSSLNDRIVEIGAVKFINGQPEKTFNTLVHSVVPIPPLVSKINGITNEMIKNSPNEFDAITDLSIFLEDALNEKNILCTHNADFDMSFLKEAFKRTGINASIIYIDTLQIARMTVNGLENYKQDLVLSHFNINNNYAHRASSDALSCGKLLNEMLPLLKEKIENQNKVNKNKKISEKEMEICSYIKKLLLNNGINALDYLRCNKISSGHIQLTCLYPFLTFKVAKKGTYILIPNQIAKKMKVEGYTCTKTEGVDSIRFFFDKMSMLDIFIPYFLQSYKKTLRSAKSYMRNSNHCKKMADESIAMQDKII